MRAYLLNLTSGQHAGLKGLSLATGVPMAGLLRQAVDSFLSGGICTILASGAILAGPVLARG